MGDIAKGRLTELGWEVMTLTMRLTDPVREALRLPPQKRSVIRWWRAGSPLPSCA
jgi:hypothetical protein